MLVLCLLHVHLTTNGEAECAESRHTLSCYLRQSQLTTSSELKPPKENNSTKYSQLKANLWMFNWLFHQNAYKTITAYHKAYNSDRSHMTLFCVVQCSHHTELLSVKVERYVVLGRLLVIVCCAACVTEETCLNTTSDRSSYSCVLPSQDQITNSTVFNSCNTLDLQLHASSSEFRRKMDMDEVKVK